MPQEGVKFTSLIKWWNWARRHPAAVILAGLLVAAFVLPSGSGTRPFPNDFESDEPPLFV
jgi:hypothetical protein